MIVKAPVDRTKLRMTVGDFVHTEMGASFQSYYHKNLRKLEWNHKVADPRLTMPGSDGKHYHYILPAVYRLIQHLHDNSRDFNIIIRTYGLDCKSVLDSLSHSIKSKKHPSFPNLPNLPLYPCHGNVLRGDHGKITVQQVGLLYFSTESLYIKLSTKQRVIIKKYLGIVKITNLHNKFRVNRYNIQIEFQNGIINQKSRNASK